MKQYLLQKINIFNNSDYYKSTPDAQKQFQIAKFAKVFTDNVS